MKTLSVSFVPLLKTSYSFTKKVTLQILLTTQNGEGRFRDPRMRAIYPNPSRFQGVRELAEFKPSTLVSFILQYTIDMIVNSPDTLDAIIDSIHCMSSALILTRMGYSLRPGLPTSNLAQPS